MSELTILIAVASGGAIGAVLRHLVSRAVAARVGHATFGTLAVNISGAFLVGAIAGLFLVPTSLAAPVHWSWALFVTGIVGSYSTVSSLSLQTLELLRAGRTDKAFANIAASLVLGLGAAALGLGIGYGIAGVA